MHELTISKQKNKPRRLNGLQRLHELGEMCDFECS